jgi:hypothetical protein
MVFIPIPCRRRFKANECRSAWLPHRGSSKPLNLIRCSMTSWTAIQQKRDDAKEMLGQSDLVTGVMLQANASHFGNYDTPG